jgi:outer membrane protein assembly factor BamB
VLNGTYLYVSVNSKSEYGQASLYCLDASNGVRVRNFTTEPGNAASSPVVADGQVYVGNTGPQFFVQPDHNVYAFNTSTGEQIWNYTIEGNSGSLTVTDGVVYVGSTFATSGNRDNEGNGAVYALKPTAVPASLQPLTIIVIAVIVVVVILAVVFFVDKTRQKGAKSSPLA